MAALQAASPLCSRCAWLHTEAWSPPCGHLYLAEPICRRYECPEVKALGSESCLFEYSTISTFKTMMRCAKKASQRYELFGLTIQIQFSQATKGSSGLYNTFSRLRAVSYVKNWSCFSCMLCFPSDSSACSNAKHFFEAQPTSVLAES